MRVYLFITILIFLISKQVYAVTPKLKDVKLKGFYHRICDPQKFFMMHGRSARKFSKMMIKQSPRWREFISERSLNLDPKELKAIKSKKVLDIWTGGKFTRSSYYRLVSKKIKPHYEGYLRLRYRNFYGVDLASRIRKLGERFLELVTDPGIISYLSDFERFVNKNYPKASDRVNPWAIRRAFSEHMGHVYFFRGMSLDSNAVGAISKLGIQAAGFRLSKQDQGKLINTKVFIDNIQQQFIDRFMNNKNPQNDPLISVTKYYSIAYEVSKRYAGPGKNIYVYKMRVPRMQVLIPKINKRSVLHMKQPLPSGVESFLPVIISPEEIVQIDHVKSINYSKKMGPRELEQAFMGIVQDASKKEPGLCGL